MAPSGAYWRVRIATEDRQSGHGPPRKGTEIGYSTGAESSFNGGQVTVTTKPEDVAGLILNGLPEAQPSADDAAYVAWYADLMRVVEREGVPPIAYADYEFDSNRGWKITGDCNDVFHPHPPQRPGTPGR
jgi:hypothetical protein